MSTGLFADEEDGYNIDKENLEETKYVLKGSAPSTDSSMEDEMSLLDEPSLDEPSLDGLDDMEAEGGDKPFDDEPFDAEIEADEDTDPEKYIQQLSGKLGQSLRQYTEDEGQPDFDLEKFAVNSVLSATHTGEMDKEDQRDIINKVKNSGNEDPEDMPVDDEEGLDEPIDNEVDNEDNFDFGEEPVEESGPREYQKNPNSNVMWHDSHWGPLPERLPVGTKFSANGKRGVVLSDYMDAGAPLTYKVKYDDGTNGLVGSADPTLNILKDGVDEVDSKFGKDERWASGDERWGGGLQESEKNRTFVDKDNIMEASEPMVPVKPVVKPKKIRKREIDRPFSPKRKDKVTAPPKFGEFIHEEGDSDGIEFNGSMVDVNTIDIEGVHMNDYPDFVDAFIASASYVDGKTLTDDELVNFQAENDMLVNTMIFDKQLYM
jgi:hypothetical protein